MTYHILVYPSLVDRHLGCFYLMAVVNGAATYIHYVGFFFIILFFFKHHSLGVELLDHTVMLCLTF